MGTNPFDDYPHPAKEAWFDAARRIRRLEDGPDVPRAWQALGHAFKSKYITPVCEELRLDYQAAGISRRFRLYNQYAPGRNHTHAIYAYGLELEAIVGAGTPDSMLWHSVPDYHCSTLGGASRPHEYMMRKACETLHPFEMTYGGHTYTVSSDPMGLNVLATPFTDDPAVQELAEILTLIPSLRGNK